MAGPYLLESLLDQLRRLQLNERAPVHLIWFLISACPPVGIHRKPHVSSQSTALIICAEALTLPFGWGDLRWGKMLAEMLVRHADLLTAGARIAARAHLAVFYLSGEFYHFAKRLFGIRHVLIQPGLTAASSRPQFCGALWWPTEPGSSRQPPRPACRATRASRHLSP